MEAYILDAVRTPRGAAKKSGSLSSQKPIELAAAVLRAIQSRNRLDTAQVEDIVMGCVTQTKEQGADLARIAALYAGWSYLASGVTLNRFCASGLDAIGYAALKVGSGMEQLVAAGGVESVSRVPMFADEGAWFSDPIVSAATDFVHMGVSADLMATLEGFEREELDEYAVESHQRAAWARDCGRFAQSLIPVENGEQQLLLDRDELIRDDSTVERYAEFEPSFAQIGAGRATEAIEARFSAARSMRYVHHRGNSPSLADGASLLLIGSREKAAELGLTPRARIVAVANAAADPLLLTGGQVATEKVLSKAGLTPQEIDLFECNEAFAATVLKYERDLGIDSERLNPNGGAIAMGHALGATGGMLMTTLLDELERREARRGIVAISGGAGVGTAILIERV